MSTIGSKRGIIRQNLLRGPKARGGMRLFLNYSTLLYLFNFKDASLLGPLVTYSTHLLLCFASKAMSNRKCQTIHLYHCISKQRILFKHRLSPVRLLNLSVFIVYVNHANIFFTQSKFRRGD